MRKNGIEIQTGLPCPCCGKLTRRQWEQPSGLPNRPAHSQTDCLNPQCAGYYMTLGVVQFFEQYANQIVKVGNDGRTQL